MLKLVMKKHVIQLIVVGSTEWKLEGYEQDNSLLRQVEKMAPLA